MKHRIKFRIVQDGGSTGKIAINIGDGEEFAFTDITLGLTPRGEIPATYCVLVVKNMTAYLHSRSAQGELAVNNKVDEEFVLHSGDIMAVAGKVVEFLDIPENEEDEPDTQHLDLNELRQIPAPLQQKDLDTGSRE